MSDFEKVYLAHHGVKGQKWGVRNYQDYDGSLTAKGRERYEIPYGALAIRRRAARRALSDADVSAIIKRHLNDKI